MLLVNIDYIPGKEFEVLGMAKGTVVQSKNFGKDFMAGMKTLVGGEITGSGRIDDIKSEELSAKVAELVEKIALSRPDISIRFIQNNQNKLRTSGNGSIKDMIYTVFGREIASNLLDVEPRRGISRSKGRSESR